MRYLLNRRRFSLLVTKLTGRTPPQAGGFATRQRP